MQQKQYSQFKAFKALTTASIRSMLKSPSSIVFSLAFPLIFILVFGFMGNSRFSISTALTPNSDTSNFIFQELKNSGLVRFQYGDSSMQNERLRKGSVSTLLDITKDAAQPGKYLINISSAANEVPKAQQLRAAVNQIILKDDSVLRNRAAEMVQIETAVVAQKEFKTIDFILPGQLGFSLLAASVFGTAFVFFHLRQMLVLKRFFATPIKRSYLLLSEGVARLVFQLLGALLIIMIGKFLFGYTLVKGVETVISMLVVCAIALLVFMSFGFMISGIAKSDSTIPPLANIFTLPQFLLAGTFFSIDALPKWLQYIAKLMPLTYFNDALRNIAFEGASLWDVRFDILILLVWGLIGYALASRTFKWE